DRAHGPAPAADDHGAAPRAPGRAREGPLERHGSPLATAGRAPRPPGRLASSGRRVVGGRVGDSRGLARSRRVRALPALARLARGRADIFPRDRAVLLAPGHRALAGPAASPMVDRSLSLHGDVAVRRPVGIPGLLGPD